MATTKLSTFTLTLALISGSMHATVPNQAQKKTATNQPQKKAVAPAPKTPVLSPAEKAEKEKKELKEEIKKYISFEIKDLAIKEIELNNKNPAEDKITITYTMKFENISDMEFYDFDADVHIIFPSGKKLIREYIRRVNFTNFGGRDKSSSNDFPSKPQAISEAYMSEYYYIKKKYREYEPDPTQPTIEEIQTAIKNNTYTTEIIFKHIDMNDGVQTKRIGKGRW
jgi:hypothetical protein